MSTHADTPKDTVALVRWLVGESTARSVHATKWACDRDGRVFFDMQSRGIYRVKVQQHRMGTFEVVMYSPKGHRVWETIGIDPYDLGTVFRTLPDHL